MCVCVCVYERKTYIRSLVLSYAPLLLLGIHKHCSIQCIDWPTQCLPMGDQWTDGGSCVAEEDSVLHVDGYTEPAPLLLHN